ncbi:MAG: carbamate kinase [Candidatus Marinimicrobia bacterium]|nr:carbamate kinase [Candidatus Neomarinimicrobiota bacterium]MBL7108962.1 carbamate kinase [Candidatus Neomarinimicrobiota bacterium]
MKRKLIIIALGGNAIKQPGEVGTAEDQFKNVALTCEQLVKMNKLGYKLILTHGNGPQAGNLLIQQEESKMLVPPMPLDVVDAMTQGEIGYMFQNQLQNAFRKDGREIPITSVITQVLVDDKDSDFMNPSKPVGPFYTPEEAMELKEKKGYIVKEVKPGAEKSWRRVVPSPEPIGLIEAEAIKLLLENRVIVITSGGGGIPVVKQSDGQLIGVEAVVDKDKAGQKLAEVVNGDIFLVLTDVECVYLNFGKPNQKSLSEITVAEAEKYLSDGQFADGSMGPKVEACIRFVKSGGERAIITSLDKAIDALNGKTGTQIINC